ncbi:porin [Membranihabitans marinus]|uniref:porin n=1 Tax=Membranihabitans marinus TaxID=1227546 RepID=UPI001F316941|nr:porin [Membranihabitans marinus]
MKIKNLRFLHLLAILILLALHTNTYAQSQSQPGIPYFTFGKGLGITSPDSLFKLNIRFRIQNRLAMETASTSDLNIDEIEARVRRLRLRYDGFFYDPRLTYVIQLSFSSGDIGGVEPGRAPNILRDAMIYYRWNKYLTIGLGQTKLPGNRQRVNSSGDLQLVDRSLLNATFNIDRDFGIQAIYRINPNSSNPWILKGAISSGEGRNWVSTSNNGLSYTSRLEFFPLGGFTSGGAYFEGDILWEDDPKIMLGLVGNYNSKIQRAGGQLGNDLYEERSLGHVMADLMFKYMGWAVQMEYIHRYSNDPITLSADGSDIRYIYAGEGINLQTSKYFPSTWEVVGRFTMVNPQDIIRPYEALQRQYTIGLNKYLRGHRLKLQSDFSLLDSELQGGESNRNFALRFQIELGI